MSAGPPLPRRECLRLLGLDESASSDQIRRAYRCLAQRYHPDKNRNAGEATRRFIDITRAYHMLRQPDPARRSRDQSVGDMHSRAASAPGPALHRTVNRSISSHRVFLLSFSVLLVVFSSLLLGVVASRNRTSVTIASDRLREAPPHPPASTVIADPPAPAPPAVAPPAAAFPKPSPVSAESRISSVDARARRDAVLARGRALAMYGNMRTSQPTAPWARHSETGHVARSFRSPTGDVLHHGTEFFLSDIGRDRPVPIYPGGDARLAGSLRATDNPINLHGMQAYLDARTGDWRDPGPILTAQEKYEQRKRFLLRDPYADFKVPEPYDLSVPHRLTMPYWPQPNAWPGPAANPFLTMTGDGPLGFPLAPPPPPAGSTSQWPPRFGKPHP
jgi:hypothetical protein